MAASKGFRRVLLQAAQQSLDGGQIDRWTMLQVRMAVAFRPGKIAEAQEMVVEQACAAGLMLDGADLDGFDWTVLLAFIKELLPLILQIISMFS